MYLIDLPLDIILLILTFLSVKHRIFIRRTCKKLYTDSSLDPLIKATNEPFLFQTKPLIERELFFRAVMILDKENFEKYLQYNSPKDITDFLPLSHKYYHSIKLQNHHRIKIKHNMTFYFENYLSDQLEDLIGTIAMHCEPILLKSLLNCNAIRESTKQLNILELLLMINDDRHVPSASYLLRKYIKQHQHMYHNIYLSIQLRRAVACKQEKMIKWVICIYSITHRDTKQYEKQWYHAFKYACRRTSLDLVEYLYQLLPETRTAKYYTTKRLYTYASKKLILAFMYTKNSPASNLFYYALYNEKMYYYAIRDHNWKSVFLIISYNPKVLLRTPIFICKIIKQKIPRQFAIVPTWIVVSFDVVFIFQHIAVLFFFIKASNILYSIMWFAMEIFICVLHIWAHLIS